MDDLLNKIAHKERELHGAKLRLRELKTRRWTGQKTDIQPDVQKLQIEIVDHRKDLAKLIVKYYNVKL